MRTDDDMHTADHDEQPRIEDADLVLLAQELATDADEGPEIKGQLKDIFCNLLQKKTVLREGEAKV